MDVETGERLGQLRLRMAELDRQILELVAARLQTSKAIGEAKRQAGLPIRDFRVEVEVLSRARKAAQEFGFDSELAEQVLECLVAAAVQTQAEQPSGHPRVGHQRILVVGGCGRMGAWLHRFFEAQGHEVHVCDPQAQGPGRYPDLDSSPLEEMDVIVLATPLGPTRQILEAVLARPTQALIFDIASLKGSLAETLRAGAAAGRRVTSLHPMFAPGAVLLHGRAVLICNCGDPQAVADARALFEDTALSLYEVTLEEHDQIMAVVLGMSHAINILFAASLSAVGLPFALLGQVSSTTFAKQVKTTAEVAEENPVLYHEIQRLNQHTPGIYDLFQGVLAELKEAAFDPQPDRFAALMARGRDYLKSSATSGAAQSP